MRRTWRWAVPVVALLMLALVLVPAELWHTPNTDGVYHGFDSNLIYVSEKGGRASKEGVVRVSRDSIELTALPNSTPTVHLVSSLLDFSADMDVRILENEPGTIPLRIDLWTPKKGIRYYLVFGPAPGNLITAHTVEDGVPVIGREYLGTYHSNQLYHVELSLDRKAGVIEGRVSSKEFPRSGGSFVLLEGGPGSPNYREVHSEPIAVQPEQSYQFGGLIKLSSGSGSYKIVVSWTGNDGQPLGVSNRWMPSSGLNGWTETEFQATSPPDAAFAQIQLGAGNNKTTRYFMSGLFLKKEGPAQPNLLGNGDFSQGSEGWSLSPGASHSEKPVIIRSPEPTSSSVTAADAPGLFYDLSNALTISSSSNGGRAGATVENYILTLPHQRGMAAKIDDTRARGLLITLIVVGSLMSIIAIGAWMRRRTFKGSGGLEDWASRSITVRNWPVLLIVVVVLFLYLVLNALLFNVGYAPFDFIGGKEWAYIGANYGPAELYYLARTAAVRAGAWGGVPFDSGNFPYGPVMAYMFTGVGWVSRLFVADPAGLRVQDFQLGFVIKSFNVLFGLLDGGLIYLILRQMGVGQRPGLLVTALFVFNPAIWFVMSVYGHTHTISIFFLLASIWLAERKQPMGAWLALIAASLTRPQMLVVSFLLGIVFLRKFSITENVHAVSWSVIAIFLLLAPFSLAISPSLPVDNLVYNIGIQNSDSEGAGEFQFVSLNAYNAWPLVTGFVEGATGRDRFFVPQSTPLVGQITYVQMGNAALLPVILLLAVVLLLNGRLARGVGDYLPIVAIAMLAFLVLRTGVGHHHFILALPLVILCWKSVNGLLYYSIVGILTVTTFVSVYGALGIAARNVGYLMPALDPSNNPITRFFMDLYAANWFITLASVANVIALAWLIIAVIRLPTFSWGRWRKSGADGSPEIVG